MICAVTALRDIRSAETVRPMNATRDIALKASPQEPVYTDPLSRKALEFSWKYPLTTQVRDFEGMQAEDIQPGSLVLVDSNRLDWLHVNVSRWLTKDYGYHPPAFASKAPASWKVMQRGMYATLYRVP
jgi:hypothetical protein